MPANSLQNSLLLTHLHKQVEPQKLSQTLKAAVSAFHKGESSYFSLTFRIPKIDPLAVLEQNNNKEAFEYYWEKPIDQYSIAAGGEIERVKTTGRNRFKEASRLGKSVISQIFHFSSINHSKAVPHLFGGFSFFDHNINKLWKSFNAASFTLPEWSIIVEGEHAALTLTLQLSDSINPKKLEAKIAYRLCELDHFCSADSYTIDPKLDERHIFTIPDQNSAEFEHWKASIEKATSHIAKNKYNKIVLARKLRINIDKPVSDTRILNRLRHQYPDCYSFLIRQDKTASFIGCTPERLALFNKDYILTEGLAGSTSRGKSASEDAKLSAQLLKSKKDLNEHEIVLKAIKKNLNNYSKSVDAPNKPTIKKLSNVQHLYTPITATIKDGVSKTEVLKNLHPTPAVGGFPKDSAVPYIPQFEHFDRGWYAAPVGWINANGNGEFVVAIRSGLIKKDEVHFFAGCGIVEGSDPEKEWEETNLKFIPMLSALEYAEK